MSSEAAIERARAVQIAKDYAEALLALRDSECRCGTAVGVAAIDRAIKSIRDLVGLIEDPLFYTPEVMELT